MEAYILFLEELQQKLSDLQEALKGGSLSIPATYTNEETLSIYKVIVDLCEKHGVVADRAYTNSFYSYSPDEIGSINNLLENVARKYKQLKQGYDGEEIVYKTLQLYDDQLHILRNYSFKQGDYEPEIDELVLSEKGIFCIEVKNWAGKCVINQAGYLFRDVGEDREVSSNIAFQTEQHVQNLRKKLKGSGVNLPDNAYVGIVCWSNKAANVTNECPSLTVCYTNDLVNQIIKKHEQDSAIISNADLQRIETYLKESKTPAKKFPLTPNPFPIIEILSNAIINIKENERERLTREAEQKRKLEDARRKQQETLERQLEEQENRKKEQRKKEKERLERQKKELKLWEETLSAVGTKADYLISRNRKGKRCRRTIYRDGEQLYVPILCGYIEGLPNFYGESFQKWATERGSYDFSDTRNTALNELYALANKYYNHPEDHYKITLDCEKSSAEKTVEAVGSLLYLFGLGL